MPLVCRWIRGWWPRSLVPPPFFITGHFVADIAGAVLMVLFGFLFVTVSSRITGVIGSSSNPISGMTIATLLLTCLIFVDAGLGRTGVPPSRCRSARSSASLPSNGGTISQDLKTGYLLGATRRASRSA